MQKAMDAREFERRMVERMRARNYARKTVVAYRNWVRRLFRFYPARHPAAIGRQEVNDYLTHLAVDRGLSASSQNQAASALAFAYRTVFGIQIGGAEGVVRAKKPKRLPTVLSAEEVHRILEQLRGRHRLIVSILYGSGLRLNEALRLRVRHLDLDTGELLVRGGKGGKDRVTMIPETLKDPIHRHLRWRARLHDRDLKQGAGWAFLPGAMARKAPYLACAYGPQFVFPSPKFTVDRRSDTRGRRPIHPTAVQKAVKRATRDADVQKRVTTHTFRHSFATHLLRNGYDIRSIQELLGHKSLKTTMIYTHVLNRPGVGVESPLDRLVREHSRRWSSIEFDEG